MSLSKGYCGDPVYERKQDRKYKRKQFITQELESCSDSDVESYLGE